MSQLTNRAVSLSATVRRVVPTAAMTMLCALAFPLGCAVHNAKPTASVSEIDRKKSERFNLMRDEARSTERDLYLKLAAKARDGSYFRRGQGGFMSGFPIVEQKPSPDSLSPKEAREKAHADYIAALEQSAARDRERNESQAHHFEKLADAVMNSGPFGDFGGPTLLDIWKASNSGTEIYFTRYESRIENYRENSVSYEFHAAPEPPQYMRLRLPNGDTAELEREGFDTYRVRP
jgi:hypothetical protein